LSNLQLNGQHINHRSVMIKNKDSLNDTELTISTQGFLSNQPIHTCTINTSAVGQTTCYLA